jgi:cytoskeletal protein CcmA (bactofilin family)
VMKSFAVALLLLGIAGSALAEETASITHKRDRILTGDHLIVTGDIAGDLIAAGGEVSVEAATDGDLVIFGGEVRVAGTVKEDVYVAGGDVIVNGHVDGNLRVAGGEVQVDTDGHIGGNASVAGGEVTIGGRIDGDLRAAGGSVLLNGLVTGDVRAVGGEVKLGPNARINGKLTYSAERELERDAAAEVTGGVERTDWPEKSSGVHLGGGHWIWTGGLIATALLALALVPGFAARVTDTVHDRFGLSMLIGLAALIVVPIAAFFLAITIVGLPVALIVLCSYPILLVLGYVFGLISLGDIGLQRTRPITVNDKAPRMLAAIVAILLVAVLGRIPVIGGLVTLAVLVLGIGALLRQFSGRPRPA